MEVMPTIHCDLLDAIDTVLVNSLKKELRSSPFVCIGVDESTDRSREKHVVTVVRYVNNSGLKTTECIEEMYSCSSLLNCER